ncbi:hypothetical protein DOTSEDRAFT_70748 [Dothistroma septosporum NZE10]|uniref:SnoaL-like domain-containing protein n=1 Tax=Dothistroma septosporum (strain NZE10 / CBS 128990) TaxID=675120 RepID=N1PVC6_DOTSN|nr:hypothetical protein DOTSEDRAFT_70748 [Dothistroma septosporum NZE10]
MPQPVPHRLRGSAISPSMLRRASSRISLRRRSEDNGEGLTTTTPPVPSVPPTYNSSAATTSSSPPRLDRVLDASIFQNMTSAIQPAEGDLYQKLATTAKGFIESTNAATPRDNNPNYELIKSYAAPHFRIDWGPKLFAQSSPVLGEAKDIDGFLNHIRSMSVNLSTWAVLIQDLSVDTRRRTVVARADFWMLPNGSEKVCNDIVFFMKMDQTGEKIIDCTEYVDPEASRIIKDRIAATRWEAGKAETQAQAHSAVNGAREEEGRSEIARKA